MCFGEGEIPDLKKMVETCTNDIAAQAPIIAAEKARRVVLRCFFDSEKIMFLDFFDMYLVVFVTFSQYLVIFSQYLVFSTHTPLSRHE